MIKKRGISAIVAVVLIILITVAGVTLVWTALLPMIRDKIDTAKINQFETKMYIDTTSGYTVYDPDTKVILIQVKRGNDDSVLVGVRITLSFEGTSYTEIVRPAPDPGQGKTYGFNLTDYDSAPTSISVSSVFLEGSSEKEGTVTPGKEVPMGGISNPPENLQLFSPCDNNGENACTGDMSNECIDRYAEVCEGGLYSECKPIYKLGAVCDGGLGTCIGEGECSALPIANIFRNSIAYWSFDEVSWDGDEGEVRDLRDVYDVDGTTNGSLTTSADGKYGRGATFDGVDDYIIIPGLSELGSDVGNEVTISAWIKWGGAGIDHYDPIVTQSDASYNGYYFYVDSHGYDSGYESIGFWRSGSEGVNTQEDIIRNQWIFVVGTRDADNNYSIYIDGIHKESAILGGTGLDKVAHIGFDAYTASYSYYYGGIDEVMIFNYSLTPSEVVLLNNTDFSIFKT